MKVEIPDIRVEVMNYIDEHGLAIFWIDDLVQGLKKSKKEVTSVLFFLTRKGYLVRLQNGLYCKPSFSDQNVLAYQYCKSGAIAYWSALSFHGLTTQMSHKIFVQSPIRIHTKKALGAQYQFVQVKPEKIGLLQKQGRGNNTFYVTGIEKSIVDSFDKMQYSGGWSETIKALHKADLKASNLILACELVNTISVTKRIAYLISLTKRKRLHSFLSYAQSKLNVSYDVLDNESEAKGNYNTEWMLDLNVSDIDILQSLTNVY